MSAISGRKGAFRYKTPAVSGVEGFLNYHGGTGSALVSQFTTRISVCEEILKGLLVQSRQMSNTEEGIIPLNDAVARDCKEFLRTTLTQVTSPEIDWEQDTGYLNVSWNLSNSAIINVLLRGDSKVIFSGVDPTGKVSEGVTSIKVGASTIISMFEEFLGDKNGAEATLTH